ncbi:MAG: deoxyhypusine synthase, partial [Bacteroidales bacterium]
MKKRDYLEHPVKHIDVTSFDSRSIIDSMRDMSFSARETANAAYIFNRMIKDNESTNILTLAGSTSAGGCMQVYVDMLESNMIDVVVATGASIVDMDFFEALGFKHYKGKTNVKDKELRHHYIDRIYDTFIDEDELQVCDTTIKEIADSMDPGVYSSREFIREMGKYLKATSRVNKSLVRVAYEKDVPVFCPAFSDSSAGFGLVMHQWKNPDNHVSIDSVKDFCELTRIKLASENTGLFIIGGGVPKNFAQDIVVCAEMVGEFAPMHKYAVQITVADARDGGCSGSTLREASSWG